MKFYYSTATCSTASHIALAEAGLDVTPIEISWKRNLNVDELAKVNPLGAVPALVTDEGNVLTQNAIILEYIADAKPGSHLLARHGSAERLETLSWLAFATADLHKAFVPILAAHRITSSDATKKELRDFATQNIAKYLSHIESNLEAKEFITGKQFTIADAALFVFIGWTKWAEIKTSPYKNISAYMKRIYQRPAVQRVLENEGLMDYLQD